MKTLAVALTVVSVFLCYAAATKSEICPEIPPGTGGICVEACSSDDDCPDGQLCCSNGCGRVCMSGIPVSEICDVEGQYYSRCAPCTGTCKNPLVPCPRMCRSGCACPDGQVIDENSNKCVDLQDCSVEIQPILVCPLLPSDVAGICVEECSSDDDCSAGELCCSNGCGHTCVPGIPAY